MQAKLRFMQLKLFLLAAILSSSASGFAQQSAEESTPTVPKNFLKVNITSLALKNYHLQYEHALSRKVSVAIGGRFMPTSSIPFRSLILEAIGDDDPDTKDLIDKSRIGNVAITPEVRFYFGKGYGKGFYLAPYYRYTKFSTNTITVNFSEGTGPQRNINLNGELSGHSGGLLLGAQWFLGKTVTLDWWIIGAHYGTGKGSFTGTPSTPFTPGEQADIRQTLEDIDVPLIDKKVSVTANNVSVSTDGAFGGLRGGIMLGVRF